VNNITEHDMIEHMLHLNCTLTYINGTLLRACDMLMTIAAVSPIFSSNENVMKCCLLLVHTNK